MKRVAVIDLGTNLFNLLIAAVEPTKFDVLFHTKSGVAIGMGGINNGIITNDAIQRAIQTLKEFKQHCDTYQVDEIKAFGTSAIRDAKNNQEFCAFIHQETGIEVQIIDGLQEAQLIYQGVKWTYDFSEPTVVVDIGGGSTEFIVANQTGMQTAFSLNIGISRIFQQLTLSDPLTPEDIATIENWLEKHSEGKLKSIACSTVVGASGTFETLYQIQYQQEFPKSFECIEMTMDNISEILEEIIHSTLHERQLNTLIPPIRQIMMAIAGVKIRWILKQLNAQKFFISPNSLKEGALYSASNLKKT